MRLSLRDASFIAKGSVKSRLPDGQGSGRARERGRGQRDEQRRTRFWRDTVQGRAVPSSSASRVVSLCLTDDETGRAYEETRRARSVDLTVDQLCVDNIRIARVIGLEMLGRERLELTSGQCNFNFIAWRRSASRRKTEGKRDAQIRFRIVRTRFRTGSINLQSEIDPLSS